LPTTRTPETRTALSERRLDGLFRGFSVLLPLAGAGALMHAALFQ
jgi:hypothetical protein